MIYVSLPLSGPVATDGQDAADGAMLALEEAGGEVAGVELRAEVLDDAAGAQGDLRWDEATTGENARTATEDAAAVAYIGELDSGATRTSLPITNEAGLLQVSPGSSAVDLVREPGTLDDPPPAFALEGERTFARVIPGDEVQAEAAAKLGAAGNFGPFVIREDGSQFGEVLATAFEERAEEIGLRTRRDGRSGVDGSTAFLAGTPEGFAGSGPLSPTPAVVAPDSFIAPGGVAVPRLARVQPVVNVVTSAAQDPAQLPDQDFVERFEAGFDRRPGRYAAYGYEAMALTLDGIERAAEGGEVRREDLVAAVLGGPEQGGPLGSYAIDDEGETTLARIGTYRLVGRSLEPFRVVRP